jgi:hypothetical protein
MRCWSTSEIRKTFVVSAVVRPVNLTCTWSIPPHGRRAVRPNCSERPPPESLIGPTTRKLSAAGRSRLGREKNNDALRLQCFFSLGIME